MECGATMISLHLEPDLRLSMSRNFNGPYLFHSIWENETKFHFGSLVEQLKKIGVAPGWYCLSKREWEIWSNMEQYGAIWKMGQPFPHNLFD